jgi:hypothetical protein
MDSHEEKIWLTDFEMQPSSDKLQESDSSAMCNQKLARRRGRSKKVFYTRLLL